MRSKDEVRAIVVEEADIPLSDEQFDEVFQMAAQADGDGGDKCCLDTFFRARHHVLQSAPTLPDTRSRVLS